MFNFIDLLLSKAFKVIPGIEYNRVSYELREEGKDSFLIYEIVIEENKTWEYLRDRVYPNLAKYLKEKKLDPSSGEGLIIALFFKDYAYLIRGKDFFKVFCEIEGLNPSALNFRVLRWLSE